MSSGKKIGLKKRLVFFNLFLASFLLIAGATNYFGLQRVSEKYQDVIHKNDLLDGALNDMNSSRVLILLDLHRLQMTAVNEARLAISDRLKDELATFHKTLEAYRAIPGEGNADAFRRVLESWKGIDADVRKVIELARMPSEDSRREIMTLLTETENRWPEFNDNCDKLQAFNDQRSADGVIEAKASGDLASWIGFLTVVVSFVVFVVAGLIFGQGLSRQITAIAERLNITSHAVLGESVKVSSASSQLAAAMTEQSSAIQETVAAVDEIAAMVSKTSENSQLSRKDSETMNHVAKNGKDSLNRVVASMGEISEGNDHLMKQIELGNAQFEKIVSLITEIGSKTKVINDIVFQTKLLSFNASVEAARAGEHGKGFAVVAEEVGNLAQMSGNAAKEIFDMLETSTSEVKRIAADSRNSVTSMLDRTRGRLSEGKNLAQECARVFDQLIVQALGVNENISDIATASKEQFSGIAEINRVMNGLGDMTQQNATSTNDTAHAAGELKRQAEETERAVTELMEIIVGRRKIHHALPPQAARSPENGKVVPFVDLRRSMRTTPSGLTSDAVGAEIPNSNDDRFEKI